MVPTPTGALTQLWTATSEEGRSHGGKVRFSSSLYSSASSTRRQTYFSLLLRRSSQHLIPFCRIGTSSPHARDEKLGDKVWEWVEKECEGF